MDLLIPCMSVVDAHSFFLWFVEHADLWFVFLFMVVESSFVPFPSELVVPPAAYLAFTKGDMNIVAIVGVATLGAIVGALINYYLSLWLGRPIVYSFANSRIGHFLLINEEKVVKAERYFDKHGAISTFIGRLIPAVRQLISIPAGLSRMNIWQFIIFTGLGAMVWNIILAVLGWFLSLHYTLKELEMEIEHYNSYLTIGGFALLAIVLAIMIIKSMRPKKAKRHKEGETITIDEADEEKQENDK